MPPKKPLPRLAAGELEMLQMLWREGSVTISEAQAALGLPIGYTTVQTRLNRLVKKGAAARTPQRPAKYSAAITSADVGQTDLDTLVERVTAGRVTPLVAHLLERHKLSAAEIKELKALVAAAERKSRGPPIVARNRMTPADIAAALVRTTLAASVAALAAWALLAWLRIDSPRIHRTAWLLVIAQGWLFVPLTIEIQTSSPLSTTKRAAGFTPAGFHGEEPIPFESESQWGRGPFATSDSLFVENSPSQKAPDPVSFVLAAWLLGTAAIVTVSAYRYWQVLRTLPLGSPPDEPTWQAEWRSAFAAAKLRRRQTVNLRVTASLGPLLHWAPWSYLILVPRELWSALASPERQAILRHELAHLRRHDLWKSLAVRILALPQWFNPLVWYAVRRFDEAAEWACDDAAAATDAGRLTFAASLLQSAEYAVAPYPASAPAARGVLTRRIHRLVSPRFKEESKMKLLIVPTLIAIVAAVQIVRIEHVFAEEPPAAAAKSPAASALQHSGPPLSQEQMDFDRLAKEFEEFARVDYVIEPPDILEIEGVKLVPKSPHHIETFDVLLIRAKGALPEQPIDNAYNVDADGSVNLGPNYGRIEVVGQTMKKPKTQFSPSFPRFSPTSTSRCTLRRALRSSLVSISSPWTAASISAAYTALSTLPG